MWNRVISSTYAHLVTAVAVTLGLALVALTAHPKKVGLAQLDAPVRSAPSLLQGSMLSPAHFRMDRPAGASSVRLFQDDRLTAQEPR